MIKDTRVSWIPVIIIIIASFARFLSPSLNSIILEFFFPVLTFWSIYKSPEILKNQYLRLYLIILLWLLLATVLSMDTQLSMKAMRSILGGGVMVVFMYYLSRKSVENGEWIMLSYIFVFLSTYYYLYTSGELVDLQTDVERIGDAKVNANDLAYELFYITIVISIFKWDGVNIKRWKVYLLYFILAITTLYISIITASRQIIVVVIPMIGLSLLTKISKPNQLGKAILYLLFIIIISIFIYNIFSANIYKGSYLETRLEENVSEDSRVALIENAIIIGIEHPLFGVGPGCTVYYLGGAFSHCTYTELLATGGIVPLLLFVGIIVSFSKLNYRRYKETKNRVFYYLFIASIMWGIYQFFYAFHTAPWLISFYFLLIGYSDSFYKKLKYGIK